jgi:hypothetical protein
MIVFEGMLVPAAKEAGMKVPEDPNDFKDEDYPHFAVFCSLQLCREMDWNEPGHNAKVLMEFTEEEIKTATLEEVMEKGFLIKGYYQE